MQSSRGKYEKEGWKETMKEECEVAKVSSYVQI